MSIVIVTYNTRDRLLRCLTSIADHPPGLDYEIILLDNASTDGTPEMVEHEFPQVQLMRSATNDGYGRGINRAMRESRGALVVFLNPDIEVTDGAFDALVEFTRTHQQAGVSSPLLVLPNGEAQPSARRSLSPGMVLLEASRLHLLLPLQARSRFLLGTYFDQRRTMSVPWVSGACHVVPRFVWNEVGPLTEETFCGFDDYDYCHRVRKAGYEVWHCADAEMVHHCSSAVRSRWSGWEVEQVAIHNTYVVLSDHWARWRARIYCLTEVIACIAEMLRDALMPRRGSRYGEETYQSRLRKRLRLLVGILSGHVQPIRRFEPAGNSGVTASRP